MINAKTKIKEMVQEVFDESRQRFGATKIAAVLKEWGIITSYKYVAGLIREMNLQSISTHSKNDFERFEKDKEKTF